MNINPVFLVVVVTSLGFGLWNLIARWTGLPPHWVAAVVSTGTLLPVYIEMTRKSAGQLVSVPPVSMISVLLLAGIVNGIGMVYYGKILGTPEEFSLSVHVPMVLGAVVLINALGGMILFGDPVLPTRIFGLAAILVGIWFAA